MKRILFLYNNYEREHTIIEIINKELKGKPVKIFLQGITDKDLVQQIFRIRPHIMFTFPITTQNQIYIYEMAKMFFRTKIVTFTTEGLFDYHDKDAVKIWAGFYSYSPTLVDYHLFWGRLAAKYIGRELFKQKKIVGKYQIRVFGNPMYEKSVYKDRQIEVLQKDIRKKVLILTGFHTSLYSKQDFINAQDVINTAGKSKKEIMQDEVLIQWCNTAKEEKIYCEKYIQHIFDAAIEHPDILFIVKLHPQEILMKKANPKRLKYLEKLKNIENILLLDVSIPIGALFPYCKLLIHYGSTADLEAYIYKVPTLKLEITDKNKKFMVVANRLTESTFYADIDDKNAISKYITELKMRGDLFKENIIIQKQLYDYMNYVNEGSYTPSKEIANFLCGNLKYHKLKIGIEEIYNMMKFIINSY